MAATSTGLPGQRTFDDLGTPLRDVTFCVLDLETTGGSPDTCAITEIGAVKVRGGVWEGTFHTLVNPGVPIPPEITVLTGITQAMVLPAPRVEAVLPALEEFVRGTVLVGHNVRFDLGFLQAALARAGRPRLDLPAVDTCALARRLVRDEVPNCRLGTLASRFRLDHQPSHRALDDALATTDLLHVLLERAAAWGVLGLDDLLALPGLDAHPQAAKLRLTTGLPRSPGVYLFVGARDEVLYVGKATNLRQRVRSYFAGDERRKVGALLRDLVRIDHRPCANALEAAVVELRLIHQHQPRYNRVGRHGGRCAYVKLTLAEPFPRLSVVTAPRQDGALYLGPLPSAAVARQVVDAIELAAPLRRCTEPVRPGRPRRAGPCAPAQLGVATCPCAGGVTPEAYRAVVDRVVAGLTTEPGLLLGPLEARIRALAAAERFEEAADVRDRAAALAGALTRQRRLDTLRRAGHLHLRLADSEVVLDGGVLRSAWSAGRGPALPLEPPTGPPSAAGPLPRQLADELLCVAAFLEAEGGRVRIEHCDGELASRLPRLPTFRPAPSPVGRRR